MSIELKNIPQLVLGLFLKVEEMENSIDLILSAGKNTALGGIELCDKLESISGKICSIESRIGVLEEGLRISGDAGLAQKEVNERIRDALSALSRKTDDFERKTDANVETVKERVKNVEVNTEDNSSDIIDTALALRKDLFNLVTEVKAANDAIYRTIGGVSSRVTSLENHMSHVRMAGLRSFK